MNIKQSPFKLICYVVGIIAVFGFSLWLRIKDIAKLPLWLDESISVVVAKQIIAGNGPRLLDGEIYERATIYHYYLAGFLNLFSGLDINTASRLANIPFFILAFVGIFILAKQISNYRVALLSMALFGFSWISISMFREARFYEMFTSFIVMICLFIYNIDKLISSSPGYQNEAWNFNTLVPPENRKKLYALLAGLLFFIWLGFDTHILTGLLLYTIILYGFGLFIYKQDTKALVLSLSCFSVLFAVLFFGFRNEFKLSYLLFYPQPEWRSLAPNFPFSAMWDYVKEEGYAYLSFITLLLVPLLFDKVKRGLIFLLSIVIGWYGLVALQGYNASAIRYFYPMLPFLSILVAYVAVTYIDIFKNIFAKIIIYILVLIVLAITIQGGMVESNSVTTFSSLNVPKTSDSDSAMAFLQWKYSPDNTVLVDINFKFNYYLAFNSLPDYEVIDSDKIKPSEGKPGITSQIDYRSIPGVKKPAYFVFALHKNHMTENFIPYLDSFGCLVYRDRIINIYYFGSDLQENGPACITR